MHLFRPLAFVAFALSLVSFYTSVLAAKPVANNAIAVDFPYIQRNSRPAVRDLKNVDSSSFVRRHFQRRNLSNRFGRSLHAEEDAPTCRWNDVAETCVVSYNAIAELFSASKNAHAQFTAQFVECMSAADENACADMSKCRWDSASSSCFFLDFYTGNEKSPCAVAAEGYVQFALEEPRCELHKTQLPCIADPFCIWEDEDHTCSGTFLPFFIGVSLESLQTAADEVREEQDLEKAFTSSFDVGAAEPDWSAILDWKPPKMVCPKWSDPMVCDFASDLSRTAPQSFYCDFRYNGASLEKCSSDPLCDIDEASKTCHASYETEISNWYDAVKNIFSSYVEPETDKKILIQSFECTSHEERTACKDPCIWKVYAEDENPYEGCEVSEMWTDRAIADAGDESDVLCNYAATLASAACTDITDSDVCIANSKCTTNHFGECVMSLDYQVRRVIEEDRKLEKAYNRLAKKCDFHSTEEACFLAS